MSDQSTPETPSELREAYERAKNEAAEANAQLAVQGATAKENIFLRAGVDIDTPLGKLFFNGYDGELDVDKVKAYAAEIGATGPKLEDAETIPVDERQQQKVRDGLAGEPAPVVTEPETDPWKDGYAAFNDRIARGDTRDRAATEVFDRIIDAATKGDERVIYDPQRWREEQAGLYVR